jgi:hypothetical protein
MREHILSEIRRVAAENGGQAPGRRVFARESGIKESEWRGVYWARWGDALVEAGFAANKRQAKLDQNVFLEKLVQAFRHFGKVPTTIELRMYRQVDPTFPAHSTLDNHFRTKATMLARLRNWMVDRAEYADVLAMLPDEDASGTAPRRTADVAEGFVYLIRSGGHYKIGRSDELERRVKEIRIALPEAAVLVHAIRTDDPAGIEAYWHRRFVDKRANGEWFKLTPTDLTAFKRRKYQ